MRFQGFPDCCGAMCLHGFPFRGGLPQWDPPGVQLKVKTRGRKLVKTFLNSTEAIASLKRYTVFVTLNQLQYRLLHDILIENGFYAITHRKGTHYDSIIYSYINRKQ